MSKEIRPKMVDGNAENDRLRAENDRLRAEIEECPTCGGDGIMDACVGYDSTSELEIMVPETCAECDGTGISSWGQALRRARKVTRLEGENEQLRIERDLARAERERAWDTVWRLMEELVRWRGARNCTLKSWPGCGEHADCATCIMLEHAP